MHSKKTGRPRTPGFTIGHCFTNCKVVGQVEVSRKDGGVRETYTLACNCGRTFVADKAYLTARPLAACRSCGSRFGAMLRDTPKQSKHPLYRCWYGMLQRCENRKHARYADYGGRGITVCARWHTLDNFAEDMGACPPGRSIERRENNKGYTPDNCYWATRKEQNNNTRANKRYTVEGVSLTLTEWAAKLGATRSAINNRITKYGWSVEAACTTPVGVPGRREGTRLIDGKSEFNGKH